jgi:hypothetical protein
MNQEVKDYIKDILDGVNKPYHTRIYNYECIDVKYIKKKDSYEITFKHDPSESKYKIANRGQHALHSVILKSLVSKKLIPYCLNLNYSVVLKK